MTDFFWWLVALPWWVPLAVYVLSVAPWAVCVIRDGEFL